MSAMSTLRCVRCKKEFDPRKITYTCDQCGETLDVVYDYSAVAEKAQRSELENRHGSLCERYRDLLPVSDNAVAPGLGEGQTPALKCNTIGDGLGTPNLYVKDETRNPTGVFKDRATVIAVAKAIEFGRRTVALASTGNAAASLAAYAARASLQSVVFVPEGTPMQKVSQSIVYGANIVQVRGDYDQTFDLMVEACNQFGWYNCSPAVNPFRTEGKKTIAYEMCEQFNWNPPDWVVVPTGNGCNLAGIWKGFKEFHRLGLIQETPRMVAIQASGADPLVSAYNKKVAVLEPVKANTLAGAIAIGRPRNFLKAFISLEESDGVAESVTDDEIVAAQVLLARNEGIFAEPGAAAGLAGIIKLVEDGTIDRKERICCIITGSGLKDPESALRGSSKPLIIEPTIKGLRAIRECTLTKPTRHVCTAFLPTIAPH